MPSETEKNEEPGPADPVPERPRLRAEGLEVLDGEVPWRNPELLPPKPEGYLYGIVLKNKGNQPCGSEEELLGRLRKEESNIEKVYLPDQERAVPLRSLNCFQPVRKKDFGKHAFRMFRFQGLLGIAAIVAAIQLNNQFSVPLFLFGILFGLIPMIDIFIQWMLYPGKKSDEELRQSLVHASVYNDWIGKGKRGKLFLWAMVAIFVAVFLGQQYAGEGYLTVTSRGAIKEEPVRQLGQWWRLFTGTLMHADIWWLHIGMNSLVLIYLGKYTNRLTNPLITPVVFVVSAFVGAVASSLFSPGRAALGSVGASGGVVGLIGFLFLLGFTRPKAFPYEFRSFTFRNVILLSILGLVPFIDNAGHAGGFAGGLICAAVYEAFHRGRWNVPDTPVKTALTAVSFGIMIFGMLTALDLFLYQGNHIAMHLPLIKW